MLYSRAWSQAGDLAKQNTYETGHGPCNREPPRLSLVSDLLVLVHVGLVPHGSCIPHHEDRPWRLPVNITSHYATFMGESPISVILARDSQRDGAVEGPIRLRSAPLPGQAIAADPYRKHTFGGRKPSPTHGMRTRIARPPDYRTKPSMFTNRPTCAPILEFRSLPNPNRTANHPGED